MLATALENRISYSTGLQDSPIGSAATMGTKSRKDASASHQPRVFFESSNIHPESLEVKRVQH